MSNFKLPEHLQPIWCEHDRATGRGEYCAWCDIARLERDLAAANAENVVLRDAINDALPWMIKLGDYIGNGTQADPMGRCNAILKMRIAVEKRDD